MDLHTLSLTNVLCSAFMAVMMGLLHRSMPEEKSFKDWTLAGLFFLLNCGGGLAMHLLTLRHQALVGLFNACVVLAHAAFISGIRRQLGLPPMLRATAILGLAAFLEWLVFRLWLDSRVWGFALLLAMLASVNTWGAATIWRRAKAAGGQVMALLTALELAYGAQLLARAAIIVLADAATQQELLRTQSLAKAGELSMFVFILLGTAFCAALVLNRQADELRRHAFNDPMTGWLNRRSMSQRLGAEWERARRSGTGFCLITFDIDHFKAINDTHGHDVGDQAICHVTQLAEDELRGYDLKFRTGGEEFVICIPAHPPETAAHVAERIRTRIADAPLAAPSGSLCMTVSVGYAAAVANDGAWADVLKRADHALYQAKQGGRNRVLAAASCEPSPSMA